MRPDDVPVLGLLRQQMSFNTDRQRVIAENVAHANTPGYTPRDLSESDFARAVQSQLDSQRPASRGGNGMLATNTRHMQSSGESASRSWSTEDAPDSETTINGNSVVLEEQMVRAQDTRMRFETAMSLYQKSLGLIRMAIKPPAR